MAVLGLYKILDNNEETKRKGKSGESLTFALKEGSKGHKIAILWEESNEPVSFEIQASRGGGQFITTYKGKVTNSSSYQEYPLGGDVASDIRILITQGVGIISEVILDNIK